MRMTRRDTMLGLAAIVGLTPLRAMAGARQRLAGRAFGTGWSISATGLADPEATARRVAATLTRMDAAFSPFRADSEITRFNSSQPRLAASEDFAQVTTAALEMARESDGAFDPTVGPAVNRFGFGPIRGEDGAGGWRRIACADGIVRRQGGVTLDLCGIAKGHAVDLLADLLRAETRDFVVEIGGEIRAEGGAPIGIADPLRGGVHSRIRLASGAVATSGDGVHAYSHAGRRYGHTIDPRTRQPLDSPIASVSIIADSAMRADALATAALVMGEDRGLAFASTQGAGALFLIREGAGLRAAHNPAFARHLI